MPASSVWPHIKRGGRRAARPSDGCPRPGASLSSSSDQMKRGNPRRGNDSPHSDQLTASGVGQTGGSALWQALDAGNGIPTFGGLFSLRNQYVGLSQGRLVRLLSGPGRLQFAGGGIGRVAWY